MLFGLSSNLNGDEYVDAFTHNRKPTARSPSNGRRFNKPFSQLLWLLVEFGTTLTWTPICLRQRMHPKLSDSFMKILLSQSTTEKSTAKHVPKQSYDHSLIKAFITFTGSSATQQASHPPTHPFEQPHKQKDHTSHDFWIPLCLGP